MFDQEPRVELANAKWASRSYGLVEGHASALAGNFRYIHVSMYNTHRTAGSEEWDVDVHTCHCIGLT
jgi:hypothetical protein